MTIYMGGHSIAVEKTLKHTAASTGAAATVGGTVVLYAVTAYQIKHF